eukprot:796540-Prymnesium_polylepis.2
MSTLGVPKREGQEAQRRKLDRKTQHNVAGATWACNEAVVLAVAVSGAERTALVEETRTRCWSVRLYGYGLVSGLRSCDNS